jgi:hypothetical protein
MSDFSLDDLEGDSLLQSGDRLQILSPEEYELLWGFPRVTQSDRGLFFTLTAPEREALEQCRSIRTEIHFLLHLGYFRARQRFFRFELPAVGDDVDYLRRRYFDNKAVADLTVSDHTRKRHVETILHRPGPAAAARPRAAAPGRRPAQARQTRRAHLGRFRLRKKSEQETQVLFELIAHRYETGSLIVTSNQPFAEWDRIFPDQMMTVAAVDRLVHHATIIEVGSDSYRRKEAPGQAAGEAATMTAPETTTIPPSATTTAPSLGAKTGDACLEPTPSG